MIDLYTDATPNGLKISVGLEEMGLKYNLHRVFLGGEQLTPEFTALNPNNKIPVLVDDGLVVTESGAILLYLAEKTGKFLPKDRKTRIKTIEMVFFQMASLGPMFGQLMVFRGPWQNKAPEVSNRYFKEVSRLYGVLNKRLEGHAYVAGDEYTIADMAIWPWYGGSILNGAAYNDPRKFLQAHDYKNLTRWTKEIGELPAVKRGRMVNRASGPPEGQLHERHDAGDFATKTQDKIGARG